MTGVGYHLQSPVGNWSIYAHGQYTSEVCDLTVLQVTCLYVQYVCCMCLPFPPTQTTWRMAPRKYYLYRKKQQKGAKQAIRLRVHRAGTGSLLRSTSLRVPNRVPQESGAGTQHCKDSTGLCVPMFVPKQVKKTGRNWQKLATGSQHTCAAT
jgi:hypothetical protein